MRLTIVQIRALFLIVLCIPASAFLFADFMHTQPLQTDKLVQGQVVKREMGKSWLGIDRPLLTIRLEGSDVLVNASLSMNGINDAPDNVTFYYSGNPRKEVYLQEETSPLLGSILFIVLSVILFLFYFVKKV